MAGPQPKVAKQTLASLFPREVLLAPKPTFAMAGAAGMHGTVADKLRPTITLNGTTPLLSAAGAIFGAPFSCLASLKFSLGS